MRLILPPLTKGSLLSLRPAGRLAKTLAASGITSMLAALLAFFSPSAHAVDGCLVLLCLAAPDWRAVPACVTPIQKLFRDLMLGRGFPTCGMGSAGGLSGTGSQANHVWASVPDNCPPQYTRAVQLIDTTNYSCDYSGAVSVFIDQQLFTRTWWRTGGDSVTEYSPAAKAQLGSWDPRFDADYATWQAAQQQALVDATAAPVSPGGM